MAINPVSLAGVTGPLSPTAPRSPAEGSGAGLPSVFGQMLGNAVHSHQNAESALQSLAVGQTDNLHEVMLQMAQADLSFHLILEIRNRLTEAYQEIMKMNV